MDEMKGKVCIVTGSNSGIGKETTLALARMGATLVMVVRDRGRGEKARTEIVDISGNTSVDLMICDISSMDSIHHFASEFKQKYDRLDVLVNNAGAVFYRREVTPEGFERTLAVDYLGHFLLTHELLDLLRKNSPSRIINVSSGLAKDGKVDLSDLQSEKKYDGMKAYSNAKLMLIMFTYELAERLRSSGVTANVAFPGFVATNLGANSGSLRTSIMFKMVRPMQIKPEKGAETSVYLASSESVRGVTGKCFAKKMETSACQTPDQALQAQLWAKTLELLGIPSEMAKGN
jgi:NAD(P)-dependent dehydrogenase (short-subunit alcohol dehydrogenase family)